MATEVKDVPVVRSLPSASAQRLGVLDRSQPHAFVIPVKKIHDGQDVTDFLSSRGYYQIMTFLFQLNGAMFPRHISAEGGEREKVQTWELGSSEVTFSEAILQLRKLLAALEDMIDEVPPNPGPRRFGNISFRRWSELVQERLPGLMKDYLPKNVLSFPAPEDDGVNVQNELSFYLLGSFGSAQRLDYGTGHELSFLAFLGSLWMLGAFAGGEPGVEERGIVLGVVEPYVPSVKINPRPSVLHVP